MAKKYKTRTRADVEASMAQIRAAREANPTHDEISTVLAAAAKFGISVTEQAKATGIDRRHIYARHGEVALPSLYKKQPKGTDK